MSTFDAFPSSLLGKSTKNSPDSDTSSTSGSSASGDEALPENRFDRTAASEIFVHEEIVFTVHGYELNVSKWARAHPGGESILKRFHGRDATRAFDRVGHSDAAKAMLKDLAVNSDPVEAFSSYPRGTLLSRASRWRRKLFTKEDPIGLHKSMGTFVLCHFFYRFAQAIFTDPSSGLGSRRGLGPNTFSIMCMVPHAILSMSSLIFHTVPKERVVGKPMIWKEFRLHSIAFALRSCICTFFAWFAIYDPEWRSFAVTASCITVLGAMIAADVATLKLCPSSNESTTATMPYWESASLETQRCFKSFYAYCQFMATLACFTTANPTWPFVVMLPIQLAALLMTLVRKGLISAKSYHMAYTASLILPYFVGLRDLFFMGTPDFIAMGILGWTLYQLRRKGYNKYTLWLPVLAARIAIGENYINYKVW